VLDIGLDAQSLEVGPRRDLNRSRAVEGLPSFIGTISPNGILGCGLSWYQPNTNYDPNTNGIPWLPFALSHKNCFLQYNWYGDSWGIDSLHTTPPTWPKTHIEDEAMKRPKILDHRLSIAQNPFLGRKAHEGSTVTSNMDPDDNDKCYSQGTEAIAETSSQLYSEIAHINSQLDDCLGQLHVDILKSVAARWIRGFSLLGRVKYSRGTAPSWWPEGVRYVKLSTLTKSGTTSLGWQISYS
jgi:hypothetical protein